MTLHEMSRTYRQSAALLRGRLRELRAALKKEEDPEKIFWLRRRIIVLGKMLQQMNELAELTEHYYERGYYRNEAYRY